MNLLVILPVIVIGLVVSFAIAVTFGALFVLIGWNLLGFGPAVGLPELSFFEAAGLATLLGLAAGSSGVTFTRS